MSHDSIPWSTSTHPSDFRIGNFLAEIFLTIQSQLTQHTTLVVCTISDLVIFFHSTCI